MVKKKKEEGINWYQKEIQERLGNHMRTQTAKKLPRKNTLKRQYDTSNGGSEYQVFFWSLVGIVVNKKQGGSVVCL